MYGSTSVSKLWGFYFSKGVFYRQCQNYERVSDSFSQQCCLVQNHEESSWPTVSGHYFHAQKRWGRGLIISDLDSRNLFWKGVVSIKVKNEDWSLTGNHASFLGREGKRRGCLSPSVKGSGFQSRLIDCRRPYLRHEGWMRAEVTIQNNSPETA